MNSLPLPAGKPRGAKRILGQDRLLHGSMRRALIVSPCPMFCHWGTASTELTQQIPSGRPSPLLHRGGAEIPGHSLRAGLAALSGGHQAGGGGWSFTLGWRYAKLWRKRTANAFRTAGRLISVRSSFQRAIRHVNGARRVRVTVWGNRCTTPRSPRPESPCSISLPRSVSRFFTRKGIPRQVRLFRLIP